MPRKTKSPDRAPDDQREVPQCLRFHCAVDDIVLEAAAGEGDSVPRFMMVAYTGGLMRIDGWRFPVVVDFAGLAIPSQTRPVRFGHDGDAGVGHTERIAIENGELIAEGVVSRDTEAAREVVKSGKRGFPWQASIGTRVTQAEFIRAGQKVTVNSRPFEGPLYVARRAVLGEISFVDLGADSNTSATIAAKDAGSQSLEEGVMPEDDDQSKKGATEDGSEVAGKEGQADGTEATPSEIQAAASVADLRTAAAEEIERIAAIHAACAGQHPDIEAKAIKEGWGTEKCELEVLRASRPKPPAIHSGEQVAGGAVLEAACMLTAKFADVEKVYDEKTLDAAGKRFRRGIGLQELVLEAAWANGYTGRSFRNDNQEVLRFAFGQNVQAAGSTINIGGILSNVTNKFLLEGFFAVEQTWRNIASRRSVNDFKAVTSYRLVGKDQYEKVAPSGELKHGTLGEETYTNQADTYGLILGIDRRDFINDDLGAVTTVPRKLGRGSGLKINDIFWATFLANTDFFKTANGNYIHGADTALGIDGLTKAEIAFMDLTDADGKPIGTTPAILLVPTALSAMGATLFKSLEMRSTVASTKYPVTNPHAGKFRVETSRYMGNTQYTGYSSKGWYLLADPNDLAVIEVAFLNGQESPTIETAEANFNTLGVQMRGYHDFGVALQEPRGGVKSLGEAE